MLPYLVILAQNFNKIERGIKGGARATGSWGLEEKGKERRRRHLHSISLFALFAPFQLPSLSDFNLDHIFLMYTTPLVELSLFTNTKAFEEATFRAQGIDVNKVKTGRDQNME